MAGLDGYCGRLLRVDLSSGQFSDEVLDQAVASRWVGGAGFGAKYLYDEVPPALLWSDPANRLILASGPLGGTRVSGSGTIAVVSKGPMTGMAASTQANGFLGAFLRSCGYDGIILQGAAPEWLYLHIDEDGPSLRDARFLLGKDTWEIEDAIREANAARQYSVFGIGPAGEHLVRFAAIVGDRGHAAGHNGVGAVMGSKKLKAVAVARGKQRIRLHDRTLLGQLAERSIKYTIEGRGQAVHQWGTGGLLSGLHRTGALPVKNYTTNIFPEHEVVNGRYTRTHYENKKAPCWACKMGCCRITTLTEGPYAGFVGEEPEYEGFAACGPLIGVTDPGGAMMLSNVVDRLGLEVNEAGWMLGFAIECFERGVITSRDTGGLTLGWGNADSAAVMMRQIANREGLGNLLAEGVRGAAEQIGGEALSIGIYTKKGNTPRTHDHRAKWSEMLDTCVGNTGTIETCGGTYDPQQLGLPPLRDQFSWEEVSATNALWNGRRLWFDTLGVCRFNFEEVSHEVECLNAATGWQLTLEDAMTIGRRIVNQLRVYNVRGGLTPALEAPSPRYASIPVDGPAAGKSVGDHWDAMLRNYYREMGWDTETGRPLPETLSRLGLANLIADLDRR